MCQPVTIATIAFLETKAQTMPDSDVEYTRDFPAWVALNVGGEVFETDLATLTGSGSMLAAMFSGRVKF